ncbi:hypothetical protein [Niveibacterium sp. SC-1]|uniref:hypothetical protein n=1 Tax=Niveibacterium sp. SC-1 TaxID=3135646 RepID=UPI00311DB7C3
MKRHVLVVALAACAAFSAQARDTELHLPLQDALNSADAKAKLTGEVKFFFGDQKHGAVAQEMGSDVTNQKTNAFNKSDEEACQWVFLSAMLQLQKRAKDLGADAVVDIQSFYKKDPFVSATEYECHAGALMAGVALKGRFVKLK